MKTRTQLILAVALAASIAACGSDDTQTTTTPVTDAGSGSADAAADNDTAATADDAVGSSGGAADTGSAPVDAGPVKPAKCQPSDSVCIETCAAAQCKKEDAACANDAKCTGFVTCVGGCQQGKEPPGDVEGATCVDKCRTIAGKAAVNLYLGKTSCTLNECVEIKKCESTLPQQELSQCANICVQAKCLIPAQECTGDKNCGWLGTCLTDCQSNKETPWPPKDHKPDAAFLPNGVTPTTCSGKCYGSVPFESGRRFLANLICAQAQCIKQQYTTPCPQTNNACINACALDKCDGVFGECTDDPACSAFFSCLNIKACGQNQACSTACQNYVLGKYGAADANTAVATYQNIASCAVSSCVGG